MARILIKCIIGILIAQSSLAADTANTTAAAPATDTAKSGDSDKLDLKQLEDKYWSAKDTDFSVIQNRAFSKEGRWYLSLADGVIVNDPYSTGYMPTVDVGYYFSEHWGIQLSREQGVLSDNSAVVNFAQKYSVSPNHNVFADYNSVNVLWVPLYAKMSALDRAIWYFDLQFGLGAGLVDYTNIINPAEGGNANRSTFGVNLDTTAHIFFSRNWAVRVDIKNTWSNEDLQRYTMAGTGAASRDLGNTTEWDTSFLVGLTYFFGAGKSHAQGQ